MQFQKNAGFKIAEGWLGEPALCVYDVGRPLWRSSFSSVKLLPVCSNLVEGARYKTDKRVEEIKGLTARRTLVG